MFLRSFRFVYQRNGSNIYNNLLRKTPFSTTPKTSKNSDLIWKLMAGGTMVIGVPWIVYNYRSKSSSHSNSQTHHHKISSESSANVVEKSKLIEKLPESVPYLIIGSGPAGFSAARSIRSNNPNTKVLIITEENHYPYSRTPLTKELWYGSTDENKLSFKRYNGKERSIYFEHEEYYLPLEQFDNAPHGGVSVAKLHKVVQLDVENRKAHLSDGQVISYEKCVIATGSKPKNLKVFEEASQKIQDKVILYHSPEDYQRLHKLLPELKSITIIGNGLVASEMAFSLMDRCKKIRSNVQINHVFNQNGVLNDILPCYLSEWCVDRIKDENVNVIQNTDVKSVQIDQNQLKLNLTNGNSLKTDICIVDAGCEPNCLELAQKSNLEIDDLNGGLMANAELQLRSNLWVAGDVASFYDQNHSQRRRDCHHDNEIYTGRLAGENVSHPDSGKPYKHYPRFWSDLGADIGFEAIGLIDARLPTFSVFAKNDDNETEKNKYNRGVLFYLKENSIVGIILWNIFDMDNMYTARQVLRDGFKNQDLNEVAKLFALYPEPEDEDENNNNNNN